MSKLIFVENYVFDQDWFHSAGLKRIDTRTKEARAEALASGVQVKPGEWPVTLQLYIRSPDNALRVLNFQSRLGEEMTVELFIDVLEQLLPEVMFEDGDKVTYGKQALPNAYKAFLMEDLQIQAQVKPESGKENKDGREGTDKQGEEGSSVREPATGGDGPLPKGGPGGGDNSGRSPERPGEGGGGGDNQPIGNGGAIPN